MAVDEDKIAKLLQQDDDALLVRLADQVVIGVGPLDPERKRALGRAWMDAQRDRLRDTICNDPRVREIRESRAGSVEAAAAVADLIASAAGKLPAATAAVLLVRSGLDQLCG